MAVKGSVAKATIEEKLKSLYTTDYIGKDGNKIYVWESDGAEKVQIAITLTCPKIQLDVPQPGLSPEGYTENGIQFRWYAGGGGIGQDYINLFHK